ncbi:hypothetical protein PAPYR_671 [Paratrimastix pyriformis]|uniref:Uncharacterized protein n=1 Tax=Paratrimastix pyriformis TaxID=342808 RepID=A0ABQ8UVR6_9EUKA|nr:hypothetical protein PAPYR_671 [Paratrimastix pyriformis]
MTSVHSLQSRFDAPKGIIEYTAGDAFMYQVFWEASSPANAQRTLAALAECAKATHRDTPCVPTYLFRISSIDGDLCSVPPRTVGELPAVRDAKRKLAIGVPLVAVRGDLTRRGVDPSLLDLDPSAPLPPALQAQPVMLEFTEIYLDERAFLEHAWSRDYLDSYARVMQAIAAGRPATTVRVGKPTTLIALPNEIACPLADGAAFFPPSASPENGLSSAAAPVLLALDLPTPAPAQLAALMAHLRPHCVACLPFSHPLRPLTTRLLCVFAAVPDASVLAPLAALAPARGECFIAHPAAAGAADMSPESERAMQANLAAAGLPAIVVRPAGGEECVGYVLHSRAGQVRPIEKKDP